MISIIGPSFIPCYLAQSQHSDQAATYQYSEQSQPPAHHRTPAGANC